MKNVKVLSLLFLGIVMIGTGGFILGFNTDIGINTSSLTSTFKLDNFNNYIINNILMKTSKVPNDSTNIETSENTLFSIIEVTNNSLENIAASHDAEQTILQTNEINTTNIEINDDNSTPVTLVNNQNETNEEESTKIVEISSVVDSENVNNNEEISQNPHTGIGISLIWSLLIIVFSINILRKKNLFNKI